MSCLETSILGDIQERNAQLGERAGLKDFLRVAGSFIAQCLLGNLEKEVCVLRGLCIIIILWTNT